jgi:hypothetical protein
MLLSDAMQVLERVDPEQLPGHWKCDYHIIRVRCLRLLDDSRAALEELDLALASVRTDGARAACLSLKADLIGGSDLNAALLASNAAVRLLRPWCPGPPWILINLRTRVPPLRP